jgi:iron complex outermembrane receptor protein
MRRNPTLVAHLAAVLLMSTSARAIAQTVPVNAGTVTADADAVRARAAMRAKNFKSGQAVRVLHRTLLDAAGPVGGAAQALTYAPGVAINSYSTSGAGKSIITINGVNQGWSGLNGNAQDGAIGVTFDGIPIADPVTGLWQAPTIPFLSMIGSTSVAYGPGNPDQRWYDSLAGTIAFDPLQPTEKPGGDIALTYGSFNQKSLTFDARTGLYDGWSSILAGGFGDGNSYRQGGGFNNPDSDYALFLKTRHEFSNGAISFGAYDARSEAFRPTYIPQSANPAITVNGLNAQGQPNPGPLYSQATSGFYGSPPFATYDKNDSNAMVLLYAKQRLDLGGGTTLHNQTWYMHIKRTHSRITDNWTQGPTQDRLLQPHTNTIGDKLWLTHDFGWNTLSLGAYALHAYYNNKANFYNPADGGGPDIINPGGTAREGAFTLDNQAAFIQDDLKPLPGLTITPGLRFSRYRLAFHQDIASGFLFAPGAATDFTAQDALPPQTEIRSGVEPSLAVNQRVLPWLALYASYAQDLKSPEVGGGGGLFQQIQGADYRLERGQYTQAGLKLDVKHAGPLGRLRAGMGFYHLRYGSQTIPITLNNASEVGVSGTSQYRGVNMYADANPLYNLHIFANASIQSAYYQSYVVENGGPPASYNGYPVSYVPSRTLNIGASYIAELGDTTIEPRGWMQYIGPEHLYNGITTAPDYRSMPGYQTFNASLKFTFPLTLPSLQVRRLAFTLTALNILDRHYNSYEYISSGGYFGTAGLTGIPAQYASNYINAYPGAPMSIYGSLSVAF